MADRPATAKSHVPKQKVAPAAHHGKGQPQIAVAAKKANAPAQQEKRKHIVLIKNCENDFSRIHSEALLPYCGLAKARLGRDKSSTGDSEQDREAQLALAYYEISCRSETHSAEIRFFGTEKTVMDCFSSAQASHIPKQVAAPGKRPREETEEAALPEGSNDDDDATAEVAEPQKAAKPVVPRFGSVEDMVTVMKTKPYYTHPPSFHLRAGSAVEDSTGGKEAVVADGVTSSAELVSCLASSSLPQTAKQLRKALEDIPGFVSCWTLYALHYRVVFASKERLFAAKSLLDQFEAESGNRITLKLPDGYSREFTAYLQRNDE